MDERIAEARFSHLVNKVKHYVPSVDGYNEDQVKDEAYAEMWKIVLKYECKWNDIVGYILHDWQPGESFELVKIVKFLVEHRGADIHKNYQHNEWARPQSLFYWAVKTKNLILVKYFLEKGTKAHEDLFGDIIVPEWELNFQEEAIVKALLEAGYEFKSKGMYVERDWVVVRHIEALAELINLRKRCAELEDDLKEAREYILELECRPPEVGGPEYEAGRARWEARKN